MRQATDITVDSRRRSSNRQFQVGSYPAKVLIDQNVFSGGPRTIN
jgi:hypothetical protein